MYIRGTSLGKPPEQSCPLVIRQNETNCPHLIVLESILSRRQTDHNALKTIEKHGGQLSMAEAIKAGIARRTLYRLTDEGKLERVTRGIYRLADLPEISFPDLVTVSLRAPKAVICLVSALSFHDLTTQVPPFGVDRYPPGLQASTD